MPSKQIIKPVTEKISIGELEINMTSRERIISTIRRGSPGNIDRVPLGDMGFSDGILSKLEHHFGVRGIAEVRKAMGIDIVCLTPVYTGPEFAYKPEGARKSFFGSDVTGRIH